jgi:hypothetical protein
LTLNTAYNSYDYNLFYDAIANSQLQSIALPLLHTFCLKFTIRTLGLLGLLSLTSPLVPASNCGRSPCPTVAMTHHLELHPLRRSVFYGALSVTDYSGALSNNCPSGALSSNCPSGAISNICLLLSLVEVSLRPTVSRPVRLGIGLPFGVHDQILSLSFL